MIFDIAARSLASNNVLLPVEQLLGDCTGQPHARSGPRAVDFRRSQRGQWKRAPLRRCGWKKAGSAKQLVLNYGECTGCGNCVEAGRGALRVAERLRALRRCQVRAPSPLGH